MRFMIFDLRPSWLSAAKSVVFVAALMASLISHADNTQENKPMNVIITFDVKESKLDSFRDIMSDVKSNLPQVAGCNWVTVYNDVENPAVFTLVESWDSQQAHQSHIESVVQSGDWEFIAGHLKTDPVSSYFQEY